MQWLMNVLKTMLTAKATDDGVWVQKPLWMSHRALSLALLAVLLCVNKACHLGLSEIELGGFAIAIATFIYGKSQEDAAVKPAALNLETAKVMAKMQAPSNPQ